MKNKALDSIREIVFGLEDGMVSTMGVVTGIAGGTQDTFIVILAGMVIISVESLSMAAGTYLSNKTEEEYYANTSKVPLHKKLHRQSIKNIKSDAMYMGIAYIIGGLIPQIPYFFMPVQQAIPFSVVATLLGLVLVGVGKAKYAKTNVVRSILEMVIISLSAAGVGYVIGKGVSYFFPQLKQVGV